jgi:signal transduction histidine kinase/DNA-binding response OmpR family regulator
MVLLVTGLFSGLGFLLHVRLVRYIEAREKIDLRDEALNLRADLERTLARAERLVWDFTRQPVQPPRQDQSARQPSEEPVILSCVPVQLPELVDRVLRVPVRKQIREYALHETLPEQEHNRGAQVFWSDLYWGAAADGQQQALMQVLVRESRAAQLGNDAAEDLAARYWLAELDMTAALHARVLRNVRCFSLLVNVADVEKTGLCCIPLNNGNPGGLQLLAQQPQPGSPDLQEVHFTVGARLREAISEYRLWQEQPEATTGAAWQYPQEIAEGASTGLRLEDLIQVHGGEFSPPAPWSCRSSEIDLLVFRRLQQRFHGNRLDQPSLRDPFRCVRLEAGQKPRIWLRAGSEELLQGLQEHVGQLLTEAGAEEEAVTWDSQTRMEDLVMSVLEVRQPGSAATGQPIFYLARAVSLEEIRNSAVEGLSAIYIIAVVATAGALILAVLVALRIAQPLQQITEVVRKINPDPNGDELQFEDVLRQLPTNRGDEVGVIARQLAKTLTEVMQAGRQIREEVGKKERAEIDRRIAEEGNQAKEQVLATISHDMRQFVHEVYDRIDLLQDGTLREDQREAVVEITASTGKLRCLIDDLLDAHRLKQGDLHVEQEEIEVRKLLSDIVRRCQAEVKRGVRLSLRSGAEVIVCSDRGKLERIIMNLLLNACKFTTAGTIEVRLERTTDGRVRIDVADTGKGMTAEEQSRVFQVQHTATQRGNRGGTGLGLYICQQLSRCLGGEISFVSRLREGTTFTVTLPQECAVITPRTAQLSQPAADRHLRLLVVDDSQPARQVISRSVQADFGQTVQIIEAASAAEALDILAHEDVDLITLDVEMPGMNGFEMLGKLKASELWRRIPVLMVTVHPDDGRASMLGADGYLNKPIRREELKTAITRVLQGTRSGPVLIVDDDEGCRRDLQRLLEGQGLEVQTAVDGEDALDRIRETLPALCLIDLLMPRMNGFALIEKLRAVPETAQIPIIVLSAVDLTAEEQQRLAPCIQQFFSKGNADIRAVRTEIQRLLATRHQVGTTEMTTGGVR